MHTESTLTALDHQTTILGLRLRRFQEFTATAFPSVVETNNEFEARKRRETQTALANNKLPGPFQKQPRQFSLSTPKLSSLGDYVKAARLFGTTDSYSTQIVRLLILILLALILNMLCYLSLSWVYFRASWSTGGLRHEQNALIKSTCSEESHHSIAAKHTYLVEYKH